MKQTFAGALPPVAKRQLQWFATYVRFYLGRNFHGLHLLRLADLDQVAGYPLLVCLNHPSWWDPLIGLCLSQRFFQARQQYAPIALAGLAKYRFFERLGFFGIDTRSRAGAIRFLRIGQTVLSHPNGALWVTPQGDFTDVRRRPLRIEPGIGHLAHRLERFAMLPLTLEYAFWNERFAEAFACFGAPILVNNGRERVPSEWNQRFAAALEATQDVLAERVQRRDPSLFESLIEGAAGVGGTYDLWRACKARLQGKRWYPEHGRY
ncbi:MAG: lysophospholipid acyltransferase family protein [Acidobacteriaceae bacterium]|nr:lysophospholipid acyltransferase family protein [Acidobacteriaceae bacterium]